MSQPRSCCGNRCGQDILATGSDLKNTFCLVKGNQLICSEHIGDLEEAEVYQHYVRSIDHLRGLFEVEPKVVVCDLHPGYFSTQYAKTLASPALEDHRGPASLGTRGLCPGRAPGRWAR